MNRRRYLIGMGTTISGASLALGTGAFSSVSATRQVAVGVADDYESYLNLTARGDGRRSYSNGNTIGFDIPGPDEDEVVGTDPKGVGSDSIYRFGRDTNPESEQGLFGITNQGTQPVEIYSTQATTSGVPSVTIYDVQTGDLLTESSSSSPLGVGDQLNCGLEIDTRGVDTADYDVTLTINAVAPDASD